MKNIVRFGALVLPMVAGSAMAAGPDLTTLTSAVDFTTTTAAVLLVSAGAIVLYLSWKAARLVIHAVKGA